MTDCIIDNIFKNIEIVKFITTVLKSVLNLVKLQSLVAKCCKRQKNKPAKFANSIYCCATRGKLIPLAGKRYQLSVPNTKVIQNLRTLQGHIFLTLEHFATKLCNFTKFRMLINAVTMNFTILIFLKILSIMQSVHWFEFSPPSRVTCG